MIKRFNPDFSLSISHELAYMRETPEGGYVDYRDYASLFSQFEALKASHDALAVTCGSYREAISKARRLINVDEMGDADDVLAKTERVLLATDATLAAIEARGVEKAIDLLLNKFSGTGHIGVPVMTLEGLAKELREAK